MEPSVDLNQSLSTPLLFWSDYIKKNLPILYQSAKKKRNPSVKIICQPCPETVFKLFTSTEDLVADKTSVNVSSRTMEHIFGPGWDIATFEWGSRGIDSIIKAHPDRVYMEYQQGVSKFTLELEVHLYNSNGIAQW
jgi:hypothetical protein